MICISTMAFVFLICFIPISFIIGVIVGGTNRMVLAVCLSFLMSIFLATFVGNTEPQKRSRPLRRIENRIWRKAWVLKDIEIIGAQFYGNRYHEQRT